MEDNEQRSQSPESILEEYVEVKLREANEWLVSNFLGDPRWIPNQLSKLYEINMSFKDWLMEEMLDITDECCGDDESVPEPDGYINDDGD